MTEQLDRHQQKRPKDQQAVELKIALVLQPELNRGMASNRAAVLASGLTARHPEILGNDLETTDGATLPGFTKVPIVVLAGDGKRPLRELAEQARNLGLTTLVFLARAQGLRSYDAYRDSVAGSHSGELDVDSLLICGDKKGVNKLTGSLRTLR